MDRLRGQQEIVIKALDAAVSGGAFGIAGATIMGDGSVVLILDTLALFEERRASHAGRRAARRRGGLDACSKPTSACARSRSARPPTRATCS